MFSGDFQCQRMEAPDERTAAFWPQKASVWVRAWYEARFQELYTGDTSMVDASQYYQDSGAWLKADDFKLPNGGYKEAKVIIRAAFVENVEDDDGHVRTRISLGFNSTSGQELGKRLLLNKTNYNTIQVNYGSETDAWMGQEVTLWVDTTVQYRGKLYPGLRLRIDRAPQPQPPAEPVRQAQQPPPDDEIPF